MNRRIINRLIVSLLVFSLILAGISPFCATRSDAPSAVPSAVANASSNIIEICTLQGLQLLDLSSGKRITDADANTGTEDEKPSKAQDDNACPYCFVTNLARVSPDNIAAVPDYLRIYRDYNVTYENAVLLSLQAERYEPRAPPYIS